MKTREIETTWHVINTAVKKGQSHKDVADVRSEIQRILACEELPLLHAGILKIIDALRHKQSDVLDRLVQSNFVNVTRLVLGALSTERAWKQFSINREAGAGVAPQDFQLAIQESHTDSSFTDDDFSNRIWKEHKRSAEQLSNKRTAEEMMTNGFVVQRQMLREWLHMIFELCKSSMESLTKDVQLGKVVSVEETLSTIASKSLPPLMHACSSMDIDSFRSLIMTAGLSATRQQDSVEQDVRQYRLCTHKDSRILNHTTEVRKSIPKVLYGLGCPAKYAKADKGNVVSAATTLFLGIWKKTILPLAFEDDTITLDSSRAYTDALRAL